MRKRLAVLMMVMGVAWGMLAGRAAAEPFFVDLSPVANRSLEDDGIAGNGEGGWTDEGTNDLFIYPPVPTGRMERNGHHFYLPAPTDTQPQTMILLRGQQLPDLPQQVEVPVPQKTGRYLYFLQTMARTPDGIGDAEVARYTVHYADGTSALIALRAGQHLHHWWTGEWYENSGADSWPILMGRNAHSIKWKRLIGVWAMRWTNPHPQKPITRITLASAGRAVPAILAITIDDADYHASEKIKAHYQRPADPPIGYFDEKLAGERRQVYERMLKEELVRGVRSIEVIRPDLLAITLDAWVAGGPGAGEEKAAALQTPQTFSIRINGGDAIQPTHVGRLSYEHWNGDIGPFRQQVLYWHTYYLQLPAPLPAGAACRVEVAGIEPPLQAAATLEFDPARTITRVIKVNQVAYASSASRRYAYLGWWAADLGAVDYDAFKQFLVIDEASGQPVHEGPITLRAERDALSGEKVYEMDLAALKPGQYHLLIDGLGRSSSFGVGGAGITELYRQTNRAYYHQRAGTALEAPYTTFVTPAHHHRVTQSGRVVRGDQPGTAEDPVREFRGGYHDAADFDVFTYHLRATAQTLGAYEMHPQAFGDGDLNIPESGNGVPDVLDEANWALLAYLELQHDDGAVPLGRGNEQDAQRDYVRKHGQAPPFGIFPPSATSSAEYAAVAAHYARLIRPFDAAAAEKYTASARKAFAWAQANPQVGDRAEEASALLRTWAAAELFCTTGDPQIHEAFKTLHRAGGYMKPHWRYEGYLPTFMKSYALSDRDDIDPAIQKELRDNLIRRADDYLKRTEAPAYRVGLGARDRGFGWGTLNGGGRYGEQLLLAHRLTGEQRYLDGASLNADFQLGCNPLSKTFITGMGDRPPLHPQIAAYLYTGPGKTGDTVAGITIYGLAEQAPSWYPTEVPPWRRWRDLGNGGAEVSSEFTITETIGASSMLYSTLHALEAGTSANAARD